MKAHMLLQYNKYNKKGKLITKTISKMVTINSNSADKIRADFVEKRLKKLKIPMADVAQLILSTPRGNFIYSLVEGEAPLKDL